MKEHIKSACNGCNVVDLNIEKDYVHLIVDIPPKIAISNFMRRLKGQTATKMFKKLVYLR